MIKCFNSFQHCFQLVFDHYAPMKVYCHKSNLKPKRLTNNLKNLINKRNKAHGQWSKDRNNASLRKKFLLLRYRVEKRAKDASVITILRNLKNVWVTRGKFSIY